MMVNKLMVNLIYLINIIVLLAFFKVADNNLHFHSLISKFV